MRNKAIFLIAFVILAMSATHRTYASDSLSATSSANITNPTDMIQLTDIRAKVLHNYLAQKNSSLTDEAGFFVREADKNQIDWRLLVSISGVESSFGLQIPNNSYNAWGFGIYGTNTRSFTSWEDGIATISASLHNQYILQWHATTVDQIGRLYASSPTWAQRVEGYMQEINSYTTHGASASLPISL